MGAGAVALVAACGFAGLRSRKRLWGVALSFAPTAAYDTPGEEGEGMRSMIVGFALLAAGLSARGANPGDG